jgi:DNA-binding beta-propeller fold protein YncE
VVERIDPATNTVVATITTGKTTDGLVVEPGAVWTVVDQEGIVERIDPATNTVVARQHLGSELRNPALGAGSLWVAGFGADQILRIAPA